MLYRLGDVRGSLVGQTKHRIARKGVETSQRLGRHRWTIERTMSWLAGCRRLHRRCERKAEHFLLSLGLFDRDQLTVTVGRLSTGQAQRLALARLLSEPSEVLLLNEPTNRLSPALVEELETALADYDGALVVVSHDRRLRRRWRGAQLAMRATETSAAKA
ncbi:ATP-binding cassette domain-containing protein [Streptomyces atratus]|uniref:ATP-binding cassette domain-containing protein n=1 Tax=Streptomyces atratus TaxID=1893 RepID=UPI003653A078